MVKIIRQSSQPEQAKREQRLPPGAGLPHTVRKARKLRIPPGFIRTSFRSESRTGYDLKK
jgi:hypothetical protein